MKLLCLGNEFIEQDSLAKEIGKQLEKDGYEIIFINDSFQPMEFVKNNNDFFILDVVPGLKEAKFISGDKISENKIISSHDFDAGFILKLFSKEKNIKIIGIPLTGDIFLLKDAVLNMLSESKV